MGSPGAHFGSKLGSTKGLIGDAARVGYFVPLNGPLNGHPPSSIQ